MDIRNVRPDERDAWLHLRELLWPNYPKGDLQREQGEILDEPDRNAVFVAVLPNRELIGFVEASLRDWAEGCETHPVGYIEGWYVQPTHRHFGVGRRLIEAAEGWARSKGCSEMGSDTELWNDVSQLAHQALGYSEATRLVCFAKKLDE
jgi:aminoglycoside 6'-N-acetyltransferase I